MKSCAFTGHRPQNLPYRENGLDESYLQKALENSLQMDLTEEKFYEDFDMEDFEDINYDDDFQMEL